MELWDVYDENGLFTGKVIERGDELLPGKYHILVLGVIRNSDGFYLATQRSRKAKYPGKWEFPGGAAKHGETPFHAVKRELMEEIGVEISEDDLVHQIIGRCDTDKFPYHFYIFVINKNISLCHVKTDISVIEKAAYLSLTEISDFVKSGLFISGIFNDKDILLRLGDSV